MQYNLSGLFSLPPRYLMEAVKERETMRGREKVGKSRKRERQLSTGGKATLSLRACELNSEEGQYGKLLAGWLAGSLAVTVHLWLSTAAQNRGEVNLFFFASEWTCNSQVSPKLLWSICAWQFKLHLKRYALPH